jgi:hypothetical protein
MAGSDFGTGKAAATRCANASKAAESLFGQ